MGPVIEQVDANTITYTVCNSGLGLAHHGATRIEPVGEWINELAVGQSKAGGNCTNKSVKSASPGLSIA